MNLTALAGRVIEFDGPASARLPFSRKAALNRILAFCVGARARGANDWKAK